jgi:hypothetical protein
LKLTDAQTEHLKRAQEHAAKAYAEVLAAKIPLSSASPEILRDLSAARDLLQSLLDQAPRQTQ